jgi:hypothetical protein
MVALPSIARYKLQRELLVAINRIGKLCNVQWHNSLPYHERAGKRAIREGVKSKELRPKTEGRSLDSIPCVS